jgi:hypothetical protein
MCPSYQKIISFFSVFNSSVSVSFPRLSFFLEDLFLVWRFCSMLKLVWLTCITGLGTLVEIYGFNLETIHCELISRFHKMPELLPF